MSYNELNFESDDDSKNISFSDKSSNGNKFNITEDDNIVDLKSISHNNIKPMLNRNRANSPSHRKPSLTGGNISDLDLLVNTKKVNSNSDNESVVSDNDNIPDITDYNKDNDDEFESESDDEITKPTSGEADENESYNLSAHNEMSDDDIDQDGETTSYNEVDADEEESEEDEEEMTYEQIQKMKADIIYKLNRLDKLGYKPSRRYSMASNLEDLKFEYSTLKRQRGIEKSVKFSRKLLMAFVSGVEFLNHKFDYFNLKLDRWSENTMENIGDYDEVFEELHDKHQDTFEMAPELRLMMMVGGSGFMYHLQQSLFQSATPEISDILRQNPDIMKSVTNAAAGNMASNIAREENDPESAHTLNMMMGGNGTGMSEPSGVDDILEELGKNTKKQVSDEIPTRKIEFGSKKNKKPKRGIQLDI